MQSNNKLEYAKFDFLSATDEKEVEGIILKGIGRLLTRIEKWPKKA